MTDTVVTHRVLQRADDVMLAFDLGELLWPVAPVERLVLHWRASLPGCTRRLRFGVTARRSAAHKRHR